jgi:hypothetical protein
MVYFLELRTPSQEVGEMVLVITLDETGFTFYTAP